MTSSILSAKPATDSVSNSRTVSPTNLKLSQIESKHKVNNNNSIQSSSSPVKSSNSPSISPSNEESIKSDSSNSNLTNNLRRIKSSIDIIQSRSSSSEIESNFDSESELIKLLVELSESKYSSITASQLRETQLGLSIGKLSKNRNSIIKSKSKSLISFWKSTIDSSNNNSNNKNSNQQRKTSITRVNSDKNKTPILSSCQSSQPSLSQSPTNSNNNSLKDNKRSSSHFDLESDSDEKSIKKQKTCIETKLANQSSSSSSNLSNAQNSPKSPIQIDTKPIESQSSRTLQASVRTDAKLGQTRHVTRDKIQQLLFDAIGGLRGQHEINLAVELESEMFKHSSNDTSSEYKQKYRELAMNLKDIKNPDLNNNLLSGEWSCYDIVRLPITELASAERKAQRQVDAKWEFDAARSDLNKLSGLTDMFRCGRCTERKCTYYQKQTRSADEPMTVFIQCTVCGNRWRQ